MLLLGISVTCKAVAKPHSVLIYQSCVLASIDQQAVCWYWSPCKQFVHACALAGILLKRQRGLV